jgi:hypothetical protein
MNLTQSQFLEISKGESDIDAILESNSQSKYYETYKNEQSFQ